ncbi:MAG: AAA family ATPase, partial [Actinobacteria bacterium]|nr:AAA family ATPase [Actinomycetota bacterium]
MSFKLHNTGLVGRDGPHRRLLAALEEVVAGHGRLVLVSGEAGIGKSALVAAATDAVDNRALVLWGTCW